MDLEIDRIDDLAQQILTRGDRAVDIEITKKNLARWFEVPAEEFDRTPTAQLEPEVLIRHLILEEQFAGYLREWGYDVSVGEDLEGREGVDFTPDVYGQLTTLHGLFEVCVNFVCDSPPSQYRVQALLEALEAYATESSEFKWGDLYIMATPFTFGRQTAASIVLQSRTEKYTVIKLESDDIAELQHAHDKYERLNDLKEHVERGQVLGPQP